MDRDLERVLAYHERSKHHLPRRFARSLGYLDWDNQPNPFRLYQGAERVALGRVEPEDEPTFDSLHDPATLPPRAVDHASVSQLFYDSLALSAWKEHGKSRWSLRCNPSSGNLHPTEAHLIGGPIEGLGEEPALWHYAPLLHALERRATLPTELARRLGLLRPAGQSLLVGLTSIHWREAWKYGERAYRYCQHDVGHAIAALAYAAAALGWQVQMAAGIDDEACARLLGIGGQRGPDAEHPDVILAIGPAPQLPTEGALAAELALEVAGEPNALSDEHHPWPAIDEVTAACTRRGAMRGAATAREPSVELVDRGLAGRRILRSRRSAVAFDGETSLEAEQLVRMLARTCPDAGKTPFAALWGPARVHLLLFVHRVRGLEPGLYLLLRDPTRIDHVRGSLRAGFAWKRLDEAGGLPLYLLEPGDARRLAATLSCHQDIAADGAFAVAMLAELDPALNEQGAWFYRHLFWEAGAIGQVLYLEAEAAGVRGTGIGCFFDDGVHELLGIEGRGLQSLYHFTVGGPVDDPRLHTLDAYHHL